MQKEAKAMKLAKVFALVIAFLAFLPSSGKAEIVGTVETGLFYRMDSGDNPWKLFQRFVGRPTMAEVRETILKPNGIRNPRRIQIGAIIFIASENLKDEFANLQKKIAEVSEENIALKKESSDLREENSTLKQEMKNLEEANESLRAELNSEKEENARLADALENTKAEVSALQQEVSTLKKSNAQLRKKLSFAYYAFAFIFFILTATIIILFLIKISRPRKSSVDFKLISPNGKKFEGRLSAGKDKVQLVIRSRPSENAEGADSNIVPKKGG